MPPCSVLLHRLATATMSGFLDTKSLQCLRPPNRHRPQGIGWHLEKVRFLPPGSKRPTRRNGQERFQKPHHHLTSGYPGLHLRLARPQLLGAALTGPSLAPCPLCLPLTVCPSHTWVEGLCCDESHLACLYQGLEPLLAALGLQFSSLWFSAQLPSLQKSGTCRSG